MEVAAQMEVNISGSNNRKRLHSGDAALLLQSSRDDYLANHCPVSDANLLQNSVSAIKICEDSDEIPANSLLALVNQSMTKCPTSLDLKADEISLTSHGGFSSNRKAEELMESSETKRKKAKTEELMESSETNNKKAKFLMSSAAVAKMPSTEEIEEFFSAAEKHEQKRFAEKYNYDIVKDVPLEGRYQWVCLKP